jgi:Bacterial Ig-like domain (group 3)/MBG domain (YGX type)
VSFTGFANGDDPSVVSGTTSGCGTTATSASPAGTYPITGCGGFGSTLYGISYDSGTLTINPAPTLVYTGQTTIAGGGGSNIFSATLLAGSTPVGGESITFTFAPYASAPMKQSCTAVTDAGTGIASCQMSNLATGVHSIEVGLAGDDIYGAQTLYSVVTVNPGTLTYTGPSTVNGGAGSFSATLLAGSAPVGGESITFTFAPYASAPMKQSCTAVTDGGTGTASCEMSNLAAGTHSVQVSFAGDGTYASQTRESVVTVNPGTLTYTGPTTVNGGDGSTTFSATFLSGSTAVGGENVTFTFAPYGSAPVKQSCTGVTDAGSGTASCEMSGLATGVHSVRVSFADDGTYSPQTLETVVTVNPAT